MIKNVNDYVDIIHLKYPEVSVSDIKKILKFGWRQVATINKRGGDVRLNSNSLNIWSYFGNLSTNSISFFNHYILKLRVKIKLMYRRKKIPWDKYYYFSFNETNYKTLLKGEVLTILLYRIKNECLLERHMEPYLFRVSGVPYQGYHVKYKLKPSDNIELVMKHNPLTLKDIMVSNSLYKELY